MNPIEQGFNEYKSFLKLHHHDPDIANHQYMTDRAFTALSPKMHLHFASCGLDSVGYFARRDAERGDSDEAECEDMEIIIATLGL